jgi:hypothetical protein
MPYHSEKKQTFHCSIHDRDITRKAPSVISAIRRHYRDSHPTAFKRMIEKSVRTRRRNA